MKKQQDMRLKTLFGEDPGVFLARWSSPEYVAHMAGEGVNGKKNGFASKDHAPAKRFNGSAVRLNWLSSLESAASGQVNGPPDASGTMVAWSKVLEAAKWEADQEVAD
jgi:hypothetical protein